VDVERMTNSIFSILAQTKNLRQEDVFKSISDNVSGASDPTMLYWVLGGAVGLVLLLAAASAFKRREARPKVVNHQGRLMKEMFKRVPLKKGEAKQLKVMAGEQGCASPLTLILCPSLMAKGLGQKSKADRKLIMSVARKMGVVRKKVL